MAWYELYCQVRRGADRETLTTEDDMRRFTRENGETIMINLHAVAFAHAVGEKTLLVFSIGESVIVRETFDIVSRILENAVR